MSASDKAIPPAAPVLLSRRQFVQGVSVVVTVLATGGAVGCGGNPGASGLVWSPIPDQVWVVGVPVMLDLAAYVSDPNGNPLTFSLDGDLPSGVILNGSVIAGTPDAPFPTTPYVCSADDGT